MSVKTNAEISFRARLESGWTKEQLMKHYDLTEERYEKIVASLKKPLNIKQPQEAQQK